MRTTSTIGVVVAVLLLFSCGSQTKKGDDMAADKNPLEVAGMSDGELNKVVGKRVCLEGQAEENKGGGFIVAKESEIAIPSVDRWPVDVLSKKVRVKGVLVKREIRGEGDIQASPVDKADHPREVGDWRDQKAAPQRRASRNQKYVYVLEEAVWERVQ